MVDNPATEPLASEQEASPAMQSFRENMLRLIDFLGLLGESIQQTVHDVANLQNWNPQAGDSAKQRDEWIGRLEERIAGFHVRMAVYREWQCVMAVTFTETYLQDALAYFAGLDSELMAESEQKANYAEIISASNLEELAMEMRDRWARNFVARGGPKYWVQNLQKKGASSLSDFQVEPMEELWGIRHLIVHQAGKVNSDFKRRHPNFQCSVGKHINISPEISDVYLNTIIKFVVSVETFFMQRQAGRRRAR